MKDPPNSLAGDVDNDGQSSLLSGLGHELGCDELGDGLGEVDTVDKDVGCDGDVILCARID